MKKELSAEEIWSTIESLHCPEKNKVGRSYSMTLSNGITYIYQVLPDGRLLSIDDWFEGYVEILGSQEAGLIYAVKFEKTQVNFYEYFCDSFNRLPTVSLKYTKKEIEELKTFADACSPIRITQEYTYEQKRFWVIESYDENFDGLITVYNITDDKIHEKCRINIKYPITDSAVIYRFPFAPYRYGIITDSLPYYPSAQHKFYIVDFLTNKRHQFFDLGYNYLHVYEYEDQRYAFYAYKKHSPVAFVQYNESDKELLSCTYYNDLTNPHSKTQKFKIGDLLVKNELIRKNSSTNSILEKVQPLQAINTAVPDDQYMSEGITGSYTLDHISNKIGEEVILVKEFVDFLISCQDIGEYVPFDYYIFRLFHLEEACNELDSKRLHCFIKSILARLRTKKYLLEGNSNFVKIELLVHSVSCGCVSSHMVEEHCYHWVDGNYKKSIIPVDFCHDCSFDFSIRISINFDPQREKDILYEEYMSREESVFSFEDLFETTDEGLSYKGVEQREEESPGKRFYKFVLS